mmetsp:Transcript_17927/g.37239  ORF Transcript_17927/g.37239 Transcript_17927/m.37239 type:complete len:159 (-) Transcript_17927:1125-1601(-)
MIHSTRKAKTGTRIIGNFLLLVCLLVEVTHTVSAVVPANEQTTPTTNDPSSRRIEVERTMQKFHATEVAGGKDAFCGKAINYNNGGDDNSHSPSWTDNNLISHDIGEKQRRNGRYLSSKERKPYLRKPTARCNHGRMPFYCRRSRCDHCAGTNERGTT